MNNSGLVRIQLELEMRNGYPLLTTMKKKPEKKLKAGALDAAETEEIFRI